MVVEPLRIALLLGLLLHRAVWEVLKARNVQQAEARLGQGWMRSAVRLVKIGVLVGILVQTLSPVVFPIGADPAATQWVGVALFNAGLSIAILARMQLGRNWSDIEVGTAAEEHQVADRGIYGLVRDPIHAGDLLLLVGLELALNSWLVLGIVAVAVVVVWKAKWEEQTLSEALPGYGAY